jgi:hypothetical protein
MLLNSMPTPKSFQVCTHFTCPPFCILDSRISTFSLNVRLHGRVGRTLFAGILPCQRRVPRVVLQRLQRRCIQYMRLIIEFKIL